MAKSSKTLKTSEKSMRTVKKTAKRTVSAEKSAPMTSKKYTNMFAAYCAFWKRGFTDWRGTTSRSGYWWVVLANALIVLFASVLLYVLSIGGISNMFEAFFGVALLWGLITYGVAIIVPSISIILRRLHDGGFSSWWIVLYPVGMFVPYVGWGAGIILLIFMLMPTKEKDNPYHKFNRQ